MDQNKKVIIPYPAGPRYKKRSKRYQTPVKKIGELDHGYFQSVIKRNLSSAS
jgi:hypothetical protein